MTPALAVVEASRDVVLPICPGCRENEVPRPTSRGGRPRTYCYECSPPGNSQRLKAVRARQRMNAKRARNEALAEGDPLEVETTYGTIKTKHPELHTICGCGRDYLTVPLGEAHICPRPLNR